MRLFRTPTLAVLAGLCGLTGAVQAQNQATGIPSLLPVPMVQYDYSEAQIQYQPSYQVAGRVRQPGDAIHDSAPLPPHHAEAAPGAGFPAPELPPTPAPTPTAGQEIWSNGDYLDGGDYASIDSQSGLENLNCWFVSGYGLAMTRDDSNPVWLSYDQADIDSALLSSRHAEMNWAGGFEVQLGRYFNGGANALQAVYWGLFPAPVQASALGSDTVGGLGSSLSFDTLEYDDGSGNGPVAVVDLYNNASRHTVTRTNQFHNVELNILGNPNCFSCGDSCCDRPRVQLGWLAGFRYFLFNEGFNFCASGDPYQIDVTNQLFGAQVGGAADFMITQRLRSFANVKFGLFGNSIDHHSQVYGDAGYAYINNPGSSFDGQDYNLCSYKADVAFLGELNLGGSYQICDWARIVGGYRAVALTGVALTTEQIPIYFGDVNGVRDVDSNGNLILHGAFGGLEVNY